VSHKERPSSRIPSKQGQNSKVKHGTRLKFVDGVRRLGKPHAAMAAAP